MEPTSPSLAPSSGATLPTASRNFSLACSSDSGKSEEEASRDSAIALC